MPGPVHGLSRFDQLLRHSLRKRKPSDTPLSSTFGRLLDPVPVRIQNISHHDVIEALDELADDMSRDKVENGPADAGMTFLGQFIDHDVTLDATTALGRRADPATISNVRTPNLDLDCVYGAGPDASNILYGSGEAGHYLMYGRKSNPLDLARTSAGKALIGDPRNDENILVAQIQSAFICLHNILMTQTETKKKVRDEVSACAHDYVPQKVWDDHVPPGLTGFEEVRRFIRLHYQWVVWNEFLPAFVDEDCLANALLHNPFGHDAPIMPVEFAGAVYRFGHATTQASYTLNKDHKNVELFKIPGFGARPKDGNVDIRLYFEFKNGPKPQKARPVGPGLGRALNELPFVEDEIALPDISHKLTVAQAKKLALRNMVRDRYTFQLASGQKFAHHLGIEDKVEIPKPLKKKGFTRTPLWFYTLQEAEEFGKGKLTGVGGTIISTVFAGLLKRDPTTVFHVPHFKPWSGFSGQPSVFAGMLDYVEKHRDDVLHSDELKDG